MHGKIIDDSERATFSEAQHRRDDCDAMLSGTIVADDIWFAILARKLWPIKTAAALEQYACTKERTARAYASGEREPAASTLRTLIRSKEGRRVVQELVGDDPPAWWREVQRDHKTAIAAREFFQRIAQIE